MILPMITFSLRPSKWSFLPRIAASVRTRVVSWKDAADKKELVSREALVIPIRTGRDVAGIPPEITISLLASVKSEISISVPGRRSVSPGSMTRTLRSIWRTITSTCLSPISTPWLR